MGRGAGNVIFRSLGGPVEIYTPLTARVQPDGKHFVSGLFFYFGGCSEAAMGGGGRGVNKPKKTGARSARARTRGQNPLVYHIFT